MFNIYLNIFGLAVISWLIGCLKFNYLWILFFSVLYIAKEYVWIKHENSHLQLQKEINLAFKKHFDKSKWIKSTDSENGDWINTMLLLFWPYIDSYLQHYFIESIKPQLRILIPTDLKPFRVRHFDMGNIPCQIGKIKMNEKRYKDDKITIDMDFIYAGNAKFDVNIRGFDAGANEITVRKFFKDNSFKIFWESVENEIWILIVKLSPKGVKNVLQVNLNLGLREFKVLSK